ncbi:general RNA polymerase II transcription factor [Entomortierella chlamydospora]|nr:general RNA polymerase II transcription factor [Entomortierella chlamydospora]
MALREENFVVLHSGSWNTKAGINVVDTNKPPAVTIRSLVGARTVVAEPTEAIEVDDTSKPDESTENTTADDSENADIKVEKSEQDSELPTVTQEQAKDQESNKPQTVYYCGSALTEAQQQYPDSELTVSTPIRNGIVDDWAAMEALWELGIKRSRNASPVLMVVPTDWTKEEHERITQIFFENFNVPGLYLAEEPLMTLYGCAAVTGLVIDIGHNKTEITPILDTQIQRNAIQTIPLAGADFDSYFLELLKADAQLVREYGEPLDLEFARHLKESSVCQVLGKDEKENKNRAQAEYNGKEFTVGSARYKAYEPLFNPDLVGKRVLNIIEAIHAAQLGCKAEKRQSLWEAIIVTGGSCQVKGLQSRIQSEIEDSLTVSENFGEFQVREVKFLKIPDYFPALKDSIVDAGFLGSEIVAKLIFPDPRNYINKVDYNESGPSVVHTKTF